MQRRFIRVVNAREACDFAAPRFGVHPFDIALLASFYRGIYKYLGELVRPDIVANFVAGRTIRADGGADDHPP